MAFNVDAILSLSKKVAEGTATAADFEHAIYVIEKTDWSSGWDKAEDVQAIAAFASSAL